MDNINSNSGNNPEQRDEELELFSYDFSKQQEPLEDSFDLNSFSSKAPKNDDNRNGENGCYPIKLFKKALMN